MNLLAPRMPARRVRVAARWTAALVVLALLDLAIVLAWLGVNALTAEAERAVREAGARRLAAETAAAPLVPAARETGELKRRRAALQTIGDKPWEGGEVLSAARVSLPAGARLSRIEVEPGGAVHLAGVASSYAAVDAYARGLAAGGFFRGVWIRQMAMTASPAATSLPAGTERGQGSYGSAAPSAAPVAAGGAGNGAGASVGVVAFDIDAWLPVPEPGGDGQGGQP